jgi:hypothetical protein
MKISFFIIPQALGLATKERTCWQYHFAHKCLASASWQLQWSSSSSLFRAWALISILQLIFTLNFYDFHNLIKLWFLIDFNWIVAPTCNHNLLMVMKALVFFSVLKSQLKHPRSNIGNFLVAKFHHFAKKISTKNIMWIYFLVKKLPKNEINYKKLQIIAIIAYNMKGCLRFYIFIFWISPNLATYVYGLWTNWATSQNWKKTIL